MEKKKTKERVAIKIIKKKKAKPSDMELVRTEIDIMKLCHHPNVVRLLDHFENAEYIFIVMEYIRGGRLTDYMKEKKFNFTEKRVAELIYEIALGVKYLHKYGIIHRDLKPDNIMIDNTGYLKVIDFGIAIDITGKDYAWSSIGTFHYMAPEVIKGNNYNSSVDYWSVGVIIYEMLYGRLQFGQGENNILNIYKEK